MERILITGARGLLGSTLVPYLRGRGYEVWAHGRAGVCDVVADLTDEGQTRRALDVVAPQVIVNLVALTDVDRCEREPQLAYHANVRCVEQLVDWIRKAPAPCHLIQISTDQVYDGIGPHKERDVTLSNYYGFSKYACELVASRVSSSIVRTNFFGPSQSPSRVSFSDWILDALRQRKPITVFTDIHFSPLSLERLASFIELLIENKPEGIFNLGSKAGLSKADFALALAAVLDLPTDAVTRGVSKKAGLMAYRPKDMRMDSTLFEDRLGVDLPTLQEEIESMRSAYINEITQPINN